MTHMKGRGPFIEFAPIAEALNRSGAPRWPPQGVVAVRYAPEGFYFCWPKGKGPGLLPSCNPRFMHSFDPRTPGALPSLGQSRLMGKGGGKDIRVFINNLDSAQMQSPTPQGEPEAREPEAEPSAPGLSSVFGYNSHIWDDTNPWLHKGKGKN